MTAVPLACPPAPFAGVFAGTRVLVTGHTGFKGAWLTLWLQRLGAEVIGYALPAAAPDLFVTAGLAAGITHLEADVRDAAALAEACRRHAPEIVIHLAAQSLVRRSYRDPAETFAVNVLGTVNVLEAVRACPSVRAAVVVTTDKCYENREWVHAYRENDPLGGADPYSASKACAELVTGSYRRAFFAGGPAAVASARAGNVIGGGDWAEARIVPDCARALAAGQPVTLRSPGAVRPWQHVLEPLAGYLWLAAALLGEPAAFADGWNFGPDPADHVAVQTLVERFIAAWGEGAWTPAPLDGPPAPEAHTLRLDTTKARTLLGWHPVYSLAEGLAATAAWYRAHATDPAFDARAFTLAQIAAYEQAARRAGVPWAGSATPTS